jgi:hypothetical protein
MVTDQIVAFPGRYNLYVPGIIGKKGKVIKITGDDQFGLPVCSDFSKWQIIAIRSFQQALFKWKIILASLRQAHLCQQPPSKAYLFLCFRTALISASISELAITEYFHYHLLKNGYNS